MDSLKTMRRAWPLNGTLVRGTVRRARLASYLLAVSLLSVFPGSMAGQTAEATGPYLAHVLEGGPSLKKPLPESIGQAKRWTETLWFRTNENRADYLIAGVGDPASTYSRYIEVVHGRPGIRFFTGSSLLAPSELTPDAWHLIVVAADPDHIQLYVDGVMAAADKAQRGDLRAEIQLAPDPVAPTMRRFSGEIGGFSVQPTEATEAEVARVYSATPNFDAQTREDNAKAWPIQYKQGIGLREPQPPDEMPTGAAPQKPEAKRLPPAAPTLRKDGNREWEIAANWRLLSNVGPEAIPVNDGPKVSSPGFDDSKWMVATVPGTVLTTMIDRGIYPDPDFGLNNLAIPESLNQHDYWYRVEFPTPKAETPALRRSLHFAGINYAAEVWLNGHKLGQIRGAFRRGDFDVTRFLQPNGVNALAVRVSPPPHPGIPQEQSIKGGPGPDGGTLTIDGPTFVDTEGWDWIPGIRDRDTGLWQGVSLAETGSVTFGDPQIITRLPLPDTTSADVELHLPLHNSNSAAVSVTVSVAFEGVSFSTHAIVAPGDSSLHLLPSGFAQLHLNQPRLWWPNGYGAPNLYHLKLQLRSSGGQLLDQHTTTFGVREVTYELTLFDQTGQLQRVEAVPQDTVGKGYDAVDVHHADMRETADGWASTIDPQAEGTSAIRPVANEPGLTDLILKVNGVRIAVRGGNWGMDDSRKRVSRDHLEPYFRLHREANLNMIRNWVGQNTEETFYQLADEYGMMIWNDFWATTENTDAEPDDPTLFVDNARDTVRRYRNHPSIVVWCGRNEGVPPPALNDMMIQMLREEDGTRFYSPSSNQVDLRPSGPYKWRDPSLYFTKGNRGFSVELGISSFPTREAFEHTVAPVDRWPVSDAWAYHDWHQSNGGDTHELMRELDRELGSFDSLAQFERRIQLFNYVDHRAIFEGMYAHLWTPNSGRMIWMTQPAWPSTMWQMYSSDYDTQASFYGVKKANAPLHVQMDLSDYSVAVVNTTQQLHPGLRVSAKVVSPDNVTLDTEANTISASSNDVTPVMNLPLASLLEKTPLVFVRLELQDARGSLVADNFYWVARDPESYRGLQKLALATIDARAIEAAQLAATEGEERTWNVQLKNTGSDAAIAVKITALHPNGERLLPAYYSDNYLSLLPGEERTITVQAPVSAAAGDAIHFTLRGWNQSDQLIPQTTMEQSGSLVKPGSQHQPKASAPTDASSVSTSATTR